MERQPRWDVVTAGKMTSQMIGQRLMAEAETNIGIKVKQSTERAEAYDVMGRGELQLGILVENMRREGFELGVCPPKVLYKKGEGGERLEPIEEVVVEVDDEFSGAVINKLSERKVREHCVPYRLCTSAPAWRARFEPRSLGEGSFRYQMAALSMGSDLFPASQRSRGHSHGGATLGGCAAVLLAPYMRSRAHKHHGQTDTDTDARMHACMHARTPIPCPPLPPPPSLHTHTRRRNMIRECWQAIMTDMRPAAELGRTRVSFECPTRGLLGTLSATQQS